jgi:hypothetical protein
MKAKEEVSFVLCLVMRFNTTIPSGLGISLGQQKGGGAAGLQPHPLQGKLKNIFIDTMTTKFYMIHTSFGIGHWNQLVKF